MSIQHKYDFAVVLSVKNANPNGDPLNGNRPRTNYEGFGEISDVCIKRKIRNRLMQSGESILIQSDDNKKDDCTSIRARIDASGLKTNDKEFKKKACQRWFDVRAFGQLLPLKKKTKGNAEKEEDGLSIAIRGPVTLQSAFSLRPVEVISTQITKSVNLEDKESKNGDSEGSNSKLNSDRMGMKHRIARGIYVFYGSINAQLADDGKRDNTEEAKEDKHSNGTGFSDDDAQKIKEALRTLFENDASSARPEGSMAVKKVIWWKHSCPSGDISSAKVHQSFQVDPESGAITVSPLTFEKNEKQQTLEPEIIDGF